MQVKIKTVKDEGEFCFCCGKELTKEYLINFGSKAAEFELCRSCLKKLNQKISKALDVK